MAEILGEENTFDTWNVPVGESHFEAPNFKDISI